MMLLRVSHATKIAPMVFKPNSGVNPKKKTYGYAAGDGFRRVANGEQLDRVLAQPALHVHGVIFLNNLY